MHQYLIVSQLTYVENIRTELICETVSYIVKKAAKELSILNVNTTVKQSLFLTKDMHVYVHVKKNKTGDGILKKYYLRKAVVLNSDQAPTFNAL